MKESSFGLKVALLILLLAFLYLAAVTFWTMPETGAEHSKTIVGFLLGSVCATLINYYWGNSSKGQSNEPTTDEAAKAEAIRIESERLEAAKLQEAKAESERIDKARAAASKVIEDASK